MSVRSALITGILVNPEFLEGVLNVKVATGNMVNIVLNSESTKLQPLPRNNKELNPWGIEYVPYESELVRFVDAVVDMAKKFGSKEQVTTEKDWELLDFIFKGWCILYPRTSKDFLDHMKEWRLRSNRLGIVRERGGAMMQHKFNVPMEIYSMIMAIFPNQEWDKKFVNKFASRFAQFRGSDRL